MGRKRWSRLTLSVIAIVVAGCSGASQTDHDDPTHAMAIAYVRKPLARGFAIEGTFSLPRVPRNRGWYASWYSYTGAQSTAVPEPPFVQAGIIRLPTAHSVLAAFVAYRGKGGANALRPLAGLADGPHRLRLALAGGTIAYSVDGRVLYRAPNARFFSRTASDPYLQVGQELSTPDDVAIGSISDLRFESVGRPTELPFSNSRDTCFYFSNGLSFDFDRSTLSVRGRFDPGVTDTSSCGS